MSRRGRRNRKRRRGSSPSKWMIIVQMLVMAGVLVFLVMFRDYVVAGATRVFNNFGGGSDLEVQKKQSDDQPNLETPAEGGPANKDDAARGAATRGDAGDSRDAGQPSKKAESEEGAGEKGGAMEIPIERGAPEPVENAADRSLKSRINSKTTHEFEPSSSDKN